MSFANRYKGLPSALRSRARDVGCHRGRGLSIGRNRDEAFARFDGKIFPGI
jgi:hypothetical protein